MSKVTDQLYISGYKFASNLSKLEQHGITHILNMSYEYDNAFPDKFTYMHIPAKDAPTERLSPWFYNIAAFIAEAKESDGTTLVHCQLGVSRSSTALLASLIINEELRLSSAFKLLKDAAPDVEPNPTFLKELRALEMEIYGECSLNQLTILDQCEAPAPLDWKESIAIILAVAATADIPHDKDKKELDCIVAKFDSVKADKTELETLMTDIVITGIESFGGRAERDLRARDALENILAVHLPQCGIFTRSEVEKILSGILESEYFSDFTMDVPGASSWVKELCRRLKESIPEPGSLKEATESTETLKP